MKILQIVVLILSFSVFAHSQSEWQPIKLSGIVFDVNGAIIVNAKVTASGQDGKKYESETNDEGKYELILPVGVYDIEFDFNGFKKTNYQEFIIVNSTYGKIYQDVVLQEFKNHKPCQYLKDCLNAKPIDKNQLKISDKIFQKPSDKLPKKQNKSKKGNK